MTPPAAGFVRADKPAGVTSHDVVAAYRRGLRGKGLRGRGLRGRGLRDRELGLKVGHAGTLDPFATGLLLVLLGSATRLQRYVLSLPKTYVATARLGWRSSTGDPDGELTRTGRIPQSLALPEGRIAQRVPMTSAVRVGGERLYRKAQRGEEVERPVREVEVHRATLLRAEGDQAVYEIECSSGTYVRTLIEALGDAYCADLRRTAIGPLTLAADSAPPSGGKEGLSEGVARASIEPAVDLLAHLPTAELDPGRARLLRNGVPVEVAAGDGVPGEGPVRLLEGEVLLGVGIVTEGTLRTEVVLPSD